MAYEKYTIINWRTEKVYNYKSNREKALKAWQKLLAKYKNPKIEYDTSVMNCGSESFTTPRGVRYEFEERFDPFGNL